MDDLTFSKQQVFLSCRYEQSGVGAYTSRDGDR